MFKYRSNKTELLDDFPADEVLLRKNLDEMEILNTYLGSKKTVINVLNHLYNSYEENFKNKIVIADLGCGNGDLLRAIANWAGEKKIVVELIGIDINPQIISYAEEKSIRYPNIKFETIDFLDKNINNYHIIFLNSVCHHFAEETLIKLLNNLNANLALVINDLHRHWLSYCGAWLLTRLLNFTYLSQIDGPLSVLRAFTKMEILNLLKKAKIQKYQIRWQWAFRWQIVIEKDIPINPLR